MEKETEAMYLWYLNPRARLPCTYEYTSTPGSLAIITVLCADLQRYLSRMWGGPPDIILCITLSTIDTGVAGGRWMVSVAEGGRRVQQ